MREEGCEVSGIGPGSRIVVHTVLYVHQENGKKGLFSPTFPDARVRASRMMELGFAGRGLFLALPTERQRIELLLVPTLVSSHENWS